MLIWFIRNFTLSILVCGSRVSLFYRSSFNLFYGNLSLLNKYRLNNLVKVKVVYICKFVFEEKTLEWNR